MRDEEISIVTGLHRREKECNKLEESRSRTGCATYRGATDGDRCISIKHIVLSWTVVKSCIKLQWALVKNIYRRKVYKF